MAANTVIQLRRSTASGWSTSNPILANGEIGYETDTGQFKIGNGTTAWASLSYGGLIGPAATQVLISYGTGTDGALTIGSGTTTLVRDMYFTNLTMSGTGILITNGWKIFVNGILDITAAQAGAIRWNGNNGATATSSAAAAAGAALASHSVGGAVIGSAGGAGTTTNGALSGNIAGQNGNGNVGGVGGAGGSGSSGVGGVPGTVSVLTSLPINRYETDLLLGATVLFGGLSASGGSGGGGNAVIAGGGGGGSGGAAGVVAIYANTINRGGSTAANCIQSNGGNGGNGFSTITGTNQGGGGGGGGGGSGWVYICYNSLTGSTATNAIQAAGGNGGNGGNGLGTGTGGTGGAGGAGGRITFLNIPASTGTVVFGSAGSTGSGPTGVTGGAGGAGNSAVASI